MIKYYRIKSTERGILFRGGEFQRILMPGRYVIPDPLLRTKCTVASVRRPWVENEQLDVIARSGALEGQAEVLDLGATERAVVWVDKRLETVLGPGLYALWNTFRKVQVERYDISERRFEHKRLRMILEMPTAKRYLKEYEVPENTVGLCFVNDQYAETLKPGLYAYWQGEDKVRLSIVDTRPCSTEVTGQEIMTADRVTLRINALVNSRVVDPMKAESMAHPAREMLYREVQMALRALVGTRDLDALLEDKDLVSRELMETSRSKAPGLGLEVLSVGIRDIILPGEIRNLMNKVTEARKAAEANLITRREETASMRSQANTAKMLESNPVLMRMRELEVLEKISDKTDLTVVLGEQGLTDRVTKLL
ncbi:MAG: slipin family protein [Candidatus Sumerlaeota bacterium]